MKFMMFCVFSLVLSSGFLNSAYSESAFEDLGMISSGEILAIDGTSSGGQLSLNVFMSLGDVDPTFVTSITTINGESSESVVNRLVDKINSSEKLVTAMILDGKIFIHGALEGRSFMTTTDEGIKVPTLPTNVRYSLVGDILTSKLRDMHLSG